MIYIYDRIISDREREEYMYILAICTILCTIILFISCRTKISEEELFYDESISPVVKEIGDNEKIAINILKYVGNDTTKVEKNQDGKIKASFYNGNTDKITIKDTDDLEDCSRVVHIAHECIHSIQEKRLVKIHFLLSNIQILYFLGIFIYFFYNRDIDLRLSLLLVQVGIFIATFFIKIVLESDATYRGPELAFRYLENIAGKEKIEEFRVKVEKKLFGMIPMSYFGLYMQGALLLIIAQVGAILI